MFHAPLTDAFVVGHASARPVDEAASQKVPSLSATIVSKFVRDMPADIWAFVAHASTGNQIELDAGGERVISNQDYCQHDRILYEVLVRPDDI